MSTGMLRAAYLDMSTGLLRAAYIDMSTGLLCAAYLDMSRGLLCAAYLNTTELASLICYSDLREGDKDRNCLEDLDVY